MELKEPGILFNRATEASEANNAFIVLDRTADRSKKIRFNAAAAHRLGFSKGKRVEFLKVGQNWYLFSSDSPDGYQVHSYGNGLYKICSTIIMEEIELLCGVNKSSIKLRIRKTNSEYKGHTLFLIDTNHPLALRRKVKSIKE